jgi:hypothetical protein
MDQDTQPYEAIIESVRAEAKQRHARWDDAVFAEYIGWEPGYIWRALDKQSAKIRERSVRIYLNLIASGVSAGYLATRASEPQTLAEFFISVRMASWLARVPPGKHAEVAATAWNIAEGARNQASWIEQYLLARAREFDDPLKLEQKALELLKPVIEPQADAVWKGPFTVTVIDIGKSIEGFLPGAMSMITPSLIRVEDRRRKSAAGVLLLPGGESRCIGRMNGEPSGGGLAAPEPDQTVAWSADSVAVGDAIVELPLMACKPLHTFALPGGYLLAAVQNSQRLWVVETP